MQDNENTHRSKVLLSYLEYYYYYDDYYYHDDDYYYQNHTSFGKQERSISHNKVRKMTKD